MPLIHPDDRRLGMDRAITRRDFLNGVAIGLGSAMAGAWLPGSRLAASQEALAAGAPYPPALTGLRGSHVGSFETFHALKDGALWKTMGEPKATREHYNLVVVGGGISGLAAAYYFRKARPDARVLVLDNHDDFGGHAKRNEFTHGGRTRSRRGS
jgi:spermidine dehydrogenase